MFSLLVVSSLAFTPPVNCADCVEPPPGSTTTAVAPENYVPPPSARGPEYDLKVGRAGLGISIALLAMGHRGYSSAGRSSWSERRDPGASIRSSVTLAEVALPTCTPRVTIDGREPSSSPSSAPLERSGAQSALASAHRRLSARRNN